MTFDLGRAGIWSRERRDNPRPGRGPRRRPGQGDESYMGTTRGRDAASALIQSGMSTRASSVTRASYSFLRNITIS